MKIIIDTKDIIFIINIYKIKKIISINLNKNNNNKNDKLFFYYK